MQSPLLKVSGGGHGRPHRRTASTSSPIPRSSPDPKARAAPTTLAGLTVPVRIEGPLDDPRIKPEIKGLFANPEKTAKTVNQIGEVLQKKFKGKPVGEALGRFLGNVQIGTRGGGEDAEARREQGTCSTRQETPQPSARPSRARVQQGDSERAPKTPTSSEILR